MRVQSSGPASFGLGPRRKLWWVWRPSGVPSAGACCARTAAPPACPKTEMRRAVGHGKRIAGPPRNRLAARVEGLYPGKVAYKWLCFDADGVLFDYDRAEKEALEGALTRVGQRLEPELHALYRQVNQELWSAWQQGRITTDELKTVRFEHFLAKAGIRARPDSFAQCYLNALARAHHLCPGCKPALKALRRRYRLAVVTNGLSSVQQARLTGSGLMPWFEVVVISEEIGVAKPARAFFEQALHRMGQPKRDKVLVVGDSWEADIAGAAACGLHTCWFNPQGLPLPKGPTVQRVVQSWAELRQWLMNEAPRA